MSSNKTFLDLLPGSKRSIKEPSIAYSPSVNDTRVDLNMSRNRGVSKFKVWSVVVVVLVFILFLTSFFFSGAKITVTPKQKAVDLNSNLVATSEEQAGSILYESMTLTDQVSKEIPASGEEHVERKASGQITVFNDFDFSSQRLIKNTRFETPEGFIYRIDQTVVVPGQTKKDGKVYPGSVDVTVYADKVGESYNIGLKDFTIPGFKGSPRFAKFYAKSKTPMTGGFLGTMKKVEEGALKSGRDELQTDLRNKLMKKAFLEKPEGFALYGKGMFVEFESLPEINQEDSVQIQEKGTLHVIIFDKKKLSNYIVRNNIDTGVGNDSDEDVDITNIDDLDFNIIGSSDLKPWEAKSLTFSIKGSAHIVWLFDEQKLKSSLLGKPKSEVGNILNGYSGIKEAEIKITPFWNMKLPQDPNKIQIKKKLSDFGASTVNVKNSDTGVVDNASAGNVQAGTSTTQAQ